MYNKQWEREETRGVFNGEVQYQMWDGHKGRGMIIIKNELYFIEQSASKM